MSNGELPPDVTPQEEMHITLGVAALMRTFKGASVGEAYGFHPGTCEACCSKLGGERYQVNYLENDDIAEGDAVEWRDGAGDRHIDVVAYLYTSAMGKACAQLHSGIALQVGELTKVEGGKC